LAGWAREALPEGATLEVVRLGERTPVIFMDVPATGGASGDTVLLYGHLDKQPEMSGWREGLGPWQPVLEGDKLYGRGGADDGYAIFASLTALRALRRDNVPHARAVVLIEACEESGSYDLPAYIEHLAPRIGELSLVVCLDSGCANYDQLWSTTSLRGLVVGSLEVSLLTEGVHSGDGSGVVASSFRVVRQLLERLEDADTGLIKLEALQVPIPTERAEQARNAAQVLGDEIWQKFPLQPGVTPVLSDNAELILNRTWRPALAVTGAEGLPALANTGNVLRPHTQLKLSLRVPPRLDAKRAAAHVKAVLEKRSAVRRERSPSKVAQAATAGTRRHSHRGSPLPLKTLETSLRQARHVPWRRRLNPLHEHARRQIPQRAVLYHRRPRPRLERPWPNEFLHLPTARKLTLCVADVLAAHAAR